MERRETAETIEKPTFKVACGALSGSWSVLGGLVGMILIVSAATAEIASAEPASLPDVASAPPPAAMDLAAEQVPDELIARVVKSVPPDVEASAPDLEELLFVRGTGWRSSKPQTADELLAAAVAGGNDPDLEPRNPFRKHSRDLFRTERPVTIGRQDMLLRLRLRAKAKRAVSVELRF